MKPDLRPEWRDGGDAPYVFGPVATDKRPVNEEEGTLASAVQRSDHATDGGIKHNSSLIRSTYRAHELVALGVGPGESLDRGAGRVHQLGGQRDVRCEPGRRSKAFQDLRAQRRLLGGVAGRWFVIVLRTQEKR